MTSFANYDLCPVVQISETDADCIFGWDAVLPALRESVVTRGGRTLAVECYPGVCTNDLLRRLGASFSGSEIFCVASAYKDAETLKAQFQPLLTDDPVFGRMGERRIAVYFEPERLTQMREQIGASPGLAIVVGTGAVEVWQCPDIVLHLGVSRWELQRRQRAHAIGNLGLENAAASASLLYKNAFFLEWRVGDELRHVNFERVDFFLDMEDMESPAMVEGDLLRKAVAKTVQRPFRVVPFFDPGPWGGQWMKQHFGLPDGPANYAWCFDCVPEENNVILGFGGSRFHLPAAVLVHEEPARLLGVTVYERFGAEFPIRFDLLDTMEGGNLSLQVHPLTRYIKEHFGMEYTQDESYYILDCGKQSHLFLGLKEGVDRDQMLRDLESANAGVRAFPAERYVNIFPTAKHDHFSIPAGTIHCSGRDNLVLEISATPYIFTFKMWDWGRLGMDGRPRPVHLEHGLANIQWDRDTEWVKRELTGQTELLSEGVGWREERTGLHSLEFLETRRTWFTEAVPQDTCGNLNVVNLVEGDAIVVESPEGAFPPMEVHYGETFIVPAAVGRYVVRPRHTTQEPLAIVKAYVRQGLSRLE